MSGERVLLIAKRIRLARERLETLLEGQTDEERRARVRQLLVALDREVGRLISIALDEASAEYTHATAALGQANTRIQRAIEDDAAFDDAVDAVLRAVDLVSRIPSLGC